MRNPYETNEIVWYVNDDCNGYDKDDNECDYIIDEDLDCYYELGEVTCTWVCPKCGHENEYSRNYDPDEREYEREWSDD